MEGSMITWNFPNWITVVLMTVSAYLLVSLLAQLVKRQAGGAGPETGTGGGVSQSQANFAGVYGASMFAVPHLAGSYPG